MIRPRTLGRGICRNGAVIQNGEIRCAAAWIIDSFSMVVSEKTIGDIAAVHTSSIGAQISYDRAIGGAGALEPSTRRASIIAYDNGTAENAAVNTSTYSRCRVRLDGPTVKSRPAGTATGAALGIVPNSAPLKDSLIRSTPCAGSVIGRHHTICQHAVGNASTK